MTTEKSRMGCTVLPTTMEVVKCRNKNIYDNEAFFENFKQIRADKINFNECIETPILLSQCFPELTGRSVLDIGCGMGQHAKQYSDMGAKSVLGIDISEKCWPMPGTITALGIFPTSRWLFEDLGSLKEEFDLITSSLVFDYAENFEELMKNVSSSHEKQDSLFVFSMSHPMSTAYDGQYPRYTRNASGKRRQISINWGQCQKNDAPAALLSIGVRPVHLIQRCLADASSDLFLDS